MFAFIFVCNSIAGNNMLFIYIFFSPMVYFGNFIFIFSSCPNVAENSHKPINQKVLAWPTAWQRIPGTGGSGSHLVQAGLTWDVGFTGFSPLCNPCMPGLVEMPCDQMRYFASTSKNHGCNHQLTRIGKDPLEHEVWPLWCLECFLMKKIRK